MPKMSANEKRAQKSIVFLVFFLLAVAAVSPVSVSAKHHLLGKGVPAKPNSLGSVIFPAKGNVYPLGYYAASIRIGNPPKVYDLDIDSGSDLTWVQCDAPCQRCTIARDRQYKPNNNQVLCEDPLSQSIKSNCKAPTDQCGYEIVYADSGSSLGVLVADGFPVKLTNGSSIAPRLAFGCGYNQKFSGSHVPPSTAGVLGLGNGKISIVSQLNSLGLIRNVFGHCLGSQGLGFVFLGDVFATHHLAWAPMTRNQNAYSSGPADVYFGGKAVVKGLTLAFDSGSSYTYFNSQVHNIVVNLVKNDLKGKPLREAPEDKTLTICWKGPKPFKSVHDVKQYFKPLELIFTSAKNIKFELPPESYLIISGHGNACLGILNGADARLGSLNIVGDISMQDKLVVYDNERKQIGWAPINCNRVPKSV